MKLTSRFLSLAGIFLIATPALAQKSGETLRIAVNNPSPALSPYHSPIDEAAAIYRDVYETLIAFDEYKKTFVPRLAKSWTRINDTTLEFSLAEGVRFHNDNSFDADDVVATLNYLKDPASKVIYNTRFTWIDRVEKLGSHKVRIVAKQPTALDIQLFAYRIMIWDGETMSAGPADYGRLSPVGTGSYKVTMLDKNKGVVAEAYEAYKGNSAQFRAPIKRIHSLPLPDRQTQIAELMTGGVHVLRNVAPENVDALKDNPAIRSTNIASPTLYNFNLDAAGRSGNAPLKDPRVRKALFMAIDRDTLIKHVVPGGEVAQKLDAPCFAITFGCSYGTKPPPYDPAGAKKLLAEAGYPNGFDLIYDVFIPNKTLGEAIAGELLKIGVRATVNPVDINLFRRRQGDGKLQAWSVLLPMGSFPDVSTFTSIIFGAPSFPYFDDPGIRQWVAAADFEMDAAKRTALYRKVFDRINEQHYIFPVSSLPTVYLHSKNVKIAKNPLSQTEVYNSDFEWN